MALIEDSGYCTLFLYTLRPRGGPYLDGLGPETSIPLKSGIYTLSHIRGSYYNFKVYSVSKGYGGFPKKGDPSIVP